MNPTHDANAAWQLFVSEPFNNTIAVVNLVIFEPPQPALWSGPVNQPYHLPF